jgi:putative flippase GtrA
VRAPRLVRYLLVSAFTFGLDLAVLTLAHGRLGWPLPVAVTVGYAVALSTNYVLNRVLTFGSHGRWGPESLRYAAAVAVNFAVVLLGVTTGLAALGAPYQLARVAAGAAEGVFMYAAMRWFVFATVAGEDRGRAALPRPARPARDPAARRRVRLRRGGGRAAGRAGR